MNLNKSTHIASHPELLLYAGNQNLSVYPIIIIFKLQANPSVFLLADGLSDFNI